MLIKFFKINNKNENKELNTKNSLELKTVSLGSKKKKRECNGKRQSQDDIILIIVKSTIGLDDIYYYYSCVIGKNY